MTIVSNTDASEDWANFVTGNIDAFMRRKGLETLEGQDLSGLTFSKIHFREGTSFRGANLTDSAFSECTFGEGCDFTGAVMDGVTGSFTSADNPIGLEERFVREFTIDYDAIEKAAAKIPVQEGQKRGGYQRSNPG